MMFEITVEKRSNQDWIWRRVDAQDFQDACEYGIEMARAHDARLHHIERIKPSEDTLCGWTEVEV